MSYCRTFLLIHAFTLPVLWCLLQHVFFYLQLNPRALAAVQVDVVVVVGAGDHVVEAVVEVLTLPMMMPL